MINIRALSVAILATFLLGACNNMPNPFKPNENLSAGIKSFEDHDFKAALASLQKAQDPALSSKYDQVIAHKYMAFTHCSIAGHEEQCRSEFRKALTIDSSFDLTKAEAGHPVWGPIFRGEKVKFTK